MLVIQEDTFCARITIHEFRCFSLSCFSWQWFFEASESVEWFSEGQFGKNVRLWLLFNEEPTRRSNGNRFRSRVTYWGWRKLCYKSFQRTEYFANYSKMRILHKFLKTTNVFLKEEIYVFVIIKSQVYWLLDVHWTLHKKSMASTYESRSYRIWKNYLSDICRPHMDKKYPFLFIF